MDGFINTKIEAQTIYEIYRACRLCGAGAGYKMPIIQNVVDLDVREVELKQKIRDCVQIEVHQDDKMPPLICELCVDKVNDFYEFLEMCRQTNKRTRLRLGLPPQTMPRGAPDAGDCILGITEPVFINDDDNEPLVKTRQSKNFKGNLKNIKNKNLDSKVKIQLPDRKETKKNKIEPRSLRSKQPSPPRLRGTKRMHEDDVALGSLQKSKRSVPMPKSILKKTENEDNSYLTPRLRGSKEKVRETSLKKENSNKKVQIIVKSTPSKPVQKKNEFYCKICKIQYNNFRSYSNHIRIHEKPPPEKKPIKKNKHVECEHCEKTFPNRNFLETHSCSSVSCSPCGRKFSSRKALASHKSYCAQKKKASVINPRWLKKVKPIQIRISKCDPLLKKSINEHYDVSCVPFDYGLDENCIYPYISGKLRIKTEPGYMVSINDDIKQAFDTDKYIHWDSEDTASDTDEEDTKQVDSLTSIALKNIFSPKLLGKVPKKRRKVKAEKAFDSILNASDIDCDIRLGIDSIIDRLNDTTDTTKNKSSDNDSLFDDDKSQSVTNDDFDALFGDGNNKNNDKAVSNDDFDSLFGKDKVNDDGNESNNVNKSLETNNSVGDGINSVSDVINDSNVSLDNHHCMDVNEVDERRDESGNNSTVDNTNSDVSKVDDKEKRKEINECSSNNDKIEETMKENLNIVQNDNNSEKSKLDLNKLNETDSKEISATKYNDKNLSNNKINDLNNDNNEVINDNEDTRKIEENVEVKINETDNIKDSIQSETLNIENKQDDNDTKDSTDYKSSIENVNTETSNSTDNIELKGTDKENTTDNKPVNGEDLEDINMEDLEDVSDSEVDDKRLMAELDAQIGEEKKV